MVANESDNNPFTVDVGIESWSPEVGLKSSNAGAVVPSSSMVEGVFDIVSLLLSVYFDLSVLDSDDAITIYQVD